MEGYSSDDMSRVLNRVDDYFSEQDIEVIDRASLSADGSGVIRETDFQSSIGEKELGQHLSTKMGALNSDALRNDVASVTDIFTLRRGKKSKAIEGCKALFVTTSYGLVKATQGYEKLATNAVPLVIHSAELTILLWLKYSKRSSKLLSMKLIEMVRLPMEPTEPIRIAFSNKIEQFIKEPETTQASAEAYSRLIYTEKEKMMALIDGDAENVKNIKIDDIEKIAEQHYASTLARKHEQLEQKNKKLEQKIKDNDEEKREKQKEDRIAEEEENKKTEEKLRRKYTCWMNIPFIAFIIGGAIGTVREGLKVDGSIIPIIMTVIGIISIIDFVWSKKKKINGIVNIAVNKTMEKKRKKDHDE